jgi:hypothetical protein
MNKLIIIIFGLFLTCDLFSQDVNFSVIHVYIDKDIYTYNKIANLYFNDTLRIALKGGNYDTLHLKTGCYNLKTNKSNEEYNQCFEANKDYYFKIEYNYIFLFGRFKLLEITSDFAKSELKGKRLIRKSLKR